MPLHSDFVQRPHWRAVERSLNEQCHRHHFHRGHFSWRLPAGGEGHACRRDESDARRAPTDLCSIRIRLRICPGSTTIFSEDWESGEDGWTKTSQGYLTGLIDWEDASKAATRFFHLNSNLPGGHSGTAAFAINPVVGQPGGGTCQPGGDYSGSHTLDSPAIVIPPGATSPLIIVRSLRRHGSRGRWWAGGDQPERRRLYTVAAKPIRLQSAQQRIQPGFADREQHRT